MAAQTDPPANFAYEYPPSEPTYSGTPSGVASHWVGVPGADPAMRWHDVAAAVSLFMVAARARVPDSMMRPDPRHIAPSEEWERWLLEAAEDRLDAIRRFLAMRQAVDMWPDIETIQIFGVAFNAYQPSPAPEPQRQPRRRRGRW